MLFLVVLEYAILASTFTIAKIALNYAYPFFLIGFRMTVAGCLLLGYLYLFRRSHLKIATKDYSRFFSTALFHIYLAFMLEFWALQYVPSAKTVIIYALTPFFAALFSYVLHREKLSPKKILGIVVGCTGLVPILAGQSGNESLLLANTSFPEAVLLVAVACACYAWFIIKDLMRKGYHLGLINGVAMLIGGLMSFVTSFFFEGSWSEAVIAWEPFLFWTLLLVMVANVISYNLYGWLLQTYSITFMTVAGFLCPIFGAFFGWLFLNEAITWHYCLALVLITSGLLLFYKEERYSAKKK